jgi:hypothetical protein
MRMNLPASLNHSNDQASLSATTPVGIFSASLTSLIAASRFFSKEASAKTVRPGILCAITIRVDRPVRIDRLPITMLFRGQLGVLVVLDYLEIDQTE